MNPNTPRTTLAALALVGLACLSCGVGEEGAICPGDDPALHIGETPTSLEDDCRCVVGVSTDYLPGCLSAVEAEEKFGSKGEGPIPTNMTSFARVARGDMWEDRGEIIMAVSLGSQVPGFVMGLNYDTGDRRIISGTYTDPSFGVMEKGEGDEWIEPTFALRGPDDKIYVYTHGTRYDPEISGQAKIIQIWRVDPDSGDRELVWQWDDDRFGQCSNGVPDNPRTLQLALEGKGFEVSADGSFYIASIRNGSPRPGVGFVNVSADGSSCRVVSMAPGLAGNDYAEGVGGGYGFGIAVEAINEVNGQLFVSDNNNLLRVDPETGIRENMMASVPGIIEYDSKRDLYHISALVPPYNNGGDIKVFDLDKKKLWSSAACVNIAEDHPYAENCIGTASGNAHNILVNSQAWLHPDGEHMIMVNGRTTFLEVDMNTGVGNHFAY